MSLRSAALLAALASGATLGLPGLRGELQELGPGESLSVGPDRAAAGMIATLTDSVAGDAMIAAGRARADGPVGGDVLGAGGLVTVGGRVGGSLRAAGGRVRLAGGVARNVTAAGGEVRIGEGGEVGGNAYLAGGSVEMAGTVRGELVAGGGEVRIDGPVAGSVRAAADRIVIGPEARIRGDLEYRSPEPLRRAPEAVVAGDVTRKPPEADPGVPGWVGELFGLAAFLLTGVVLVAAFPRSAARLRRTARERPLPSLGAGLLIAVVAPVLLGVALVTMVGLPLALVAGALFAFALYAGRVVLALWLGDAVLGERAGEGRRRAVLGVLAGGALLFLVGLLPWLGPLVTVLATALGLGAAALALRAHAAAA